MKNINFKSNSGIILIESILALTIIVIVLTALVTALVFSVSTSNFSKEQTVAASYAQEGLEIVRNDKEVRYERLNLLDNGTYCLPEVESLADNGTPIEDGCIPFDEDERYTRTIYLNKAGWDRRSNPHALRCETNQAIFVASTVAWTDSRCEPGENCHVVELNSCFVDLN